MSKRQKKAKNNQQSSFEYDIRPAAGILNVFSRLNYKAHYAIAEFVDNSTQSYLMHSEELSGSEENYRLVVNIEYDADRHILTITDNAYGMEKDRFLDAITLDAKNSEQVNSRNEFGMGLKTAASWFGNIWSVSSTALGSNRSYEATVNIPRLQKTGENNISIEVGEAGSGEHGTTITIAEVTKGMGSRTIGKIRSLLASMYRRDLASGNIRIVFNGYEIEFVGYPILNFRDTEWKKDLDFNIEFGGREYRTTGFVGIMNPGSFPKAGFALFRRNRVVVGGEGQNYKPYEIFGQAQTQVSLKLFGELNMDDYPVNQAKDGFIWDDGLEDEFLKGLQANIVEFISIARLTKTERASEELFSEDASQRVSESVCQTLQSAFGDDRGSDSAEEDNGAEIDTGSVDAQDSNLQEVIDRFKNEQAEFDQSCPDENVGAVRRYQITLDRFTNRTIDVSWTIGNGTRWIDVDNSGCVVAVQININHPFFKPYSNEEEFQYVLEKLVIALVMAEEKAKSVSFEEGLVPASAIRSNMNDLLYKLGG